MRRSKLQAVEQPDGVLRHVRQRVAGYLAGVAQQLGKRRRRPLQMGRAPDVAVVEAHHIQPARGELPAEVLLPGDHLRAQAHDQQRRRILRVAKRLVTEGDPPAHVAELLGHDPTTLASPHR